MTFGEYLQMLHLYVGIDWDKQDYIQNLSLLIMKEPETDKEIEEDERQEYYPLSASEADRDYSLKIYNGRALSKNKAKKIKKHYKPDALIEELEALESDNFTDFINDLRRKGVNCNGTNAITYSVELLKLLIDSAAVGVGEVDPSIIGTIEPTIPVYDDTELKMKYGVHLLAETNNRCPCCYDPLYIGENGNDAFVYTVVTINPKIKVESQDNMIATCRDCGDNYRRLRTDEKQEKLEDTKMRLIQLMESMDILTEEKVVAGVERIIAKIPEIPFESTMGLNYSPTEVINKMDRTDIPLMNKIYGYVTKYYEILQSMFQNAELEGNFKYDRFCRQIKKKYQDISELGMPQSWVFDQMVEWLAAETNESTSSCEIVISYFVQKCEVFDALS